MYIYSCRGPYWAPFNLKLCHLMYAASQAFITLLLCLLRAPLRPRRYLCLRSGQYPDFPHENQIPLARSLSC